MSATGDRNGHREYGPQRPSLAPAALSMGQAAAYLDMSPDSFRRHVLPFVPVVRVGKLKRVRTAHLDAWMEQREESVAATLRGKASPARSTNGAVERKTRAIPSRSPER
jgi:hypothetical protein